MILYYARHGQVIPSEFQGDELYQKYDRPLTEIGQIQAEYLGKKMKETGFSGRIYSSPFRRALQTAEKVARETGCPITPVGWLHERFTNQESAVDFRGMTREMILTRFRYIDPDFTLPDPWFAGKAETLEEVDRRIFPPLKALIEKNEDCMLIGHGASLSGVRRYFGIEHPKTLQSWNCGLTSLKIEDGTTELLTFFDVSFLPEEYVTTNGRTRAECQNEPVKEGI